MVSKSPQDISVRTHSELTAVWRNLMGPGGFGRRTLWHVFINPDGRMNPVIMPVDDVPTEPDPTLLAHIDRVVRGIISETGAASVAVMLSRPGPGRMAEDDRRWARALHAAFGGASPWPIHLATSDLVQVFAPDDLIAA